MRQALEAYERPDGSGTLHAYAGDSPVALCGQSISVLLPLPWPTHAVDLAGVDVCPQCRRMVYGPANAPGR